VNKRDHAQLKADLTEPYDFLYDTERGAPPAPELDLRAKFDSYAPIVSYYTSPRFADVPFPCGEDWMAAVGKWFPANGPNKADSFFADNREKFARSLGGEAGAWQVGLGRIIALHHCPSTLYQRSLRYGTSVS
jgi:hypothetical protein